MFCGFERYKNGGNEVDDCYQQSPPCLAPGQVRVRTLGSVGSKFSCGGDTKCCGGHLLCTDGLSARPEVIKRNHIRHHRSKHATDDLCLPEIHAVMRMVICCLNMSVY